MSKPVTSSPNPKLDTKKQKYSPKYIRRKVLFMIAYHNMTNKKMRTWLTVGGVVIGIGAIVFLVSLGLGLQNLVTKEVVGSKSVKAIDVSSPKPRILHLDKAVVDKFKHYGEVTDIGKTYSFAGKVNFQNSTTDTVIYGADKSYLDLSALRLVAGKKIEISSNDELLINQSLLKTMGIKDANSVIGRTIKITIPEDKSTSSTSQVKLPFIKEMKVIGVLETGSGAEVFASDKLFTESGFRDFNQLKVVVRNNEDVAKVRKQIESLGYTTASPIDTLEQINQVFTFLNFLLAGFGGIGMIIAVLGMFNTLTISLLERTREIGLMVSLGARKRDVRRLFIIEALLLSLIGALIGLLSAWGLSSIINIGLMNYAKSRGVEQNISLFYIPLWLILMVIIFTCLVGFAVVAYPARRAGRISPIDALRHE